MGKDKHARKIANILVRKETKKELKKRKIKKIAKLERDVTWDEFLLEATDEKD